MPLPIDRTNLNLAIANQVPNAIIQSAKNINAISTLYDGSDALYAYVLAALAAYSGTGGAASIGTNAIAGLSTANVQGMLAEIEAQVQALVISAIPTGSITTAMIQNLAVTTAKIALQAITAAQIADATITAQQLAPNSVTYADADVGTQMELLGGFNYAYKNGGFF